MTSPPRLANILKWIIITIATIIGVDIVGHHPFPSTRSSSNPHFGRCFVPNGDLSCKGRTWMRSSRSAAIPPQPLASRPHVVIPHPRGPPTSRTLPREIPGSCRVMMRRQSTSFQAESRSQALKGAMAQVGSEPVQRMANKHGRCGLGLRHCQRTGGRGHASQGTLCKSTWSTRSPSWLV